jgi:hypothetical protein
MLRRLAAGMVVAVTLSGAAFATGSALVPAPALARSACTGWTSDSIPPETIRVLRTLGPDAGRVQEVPFRPYVELVMAAEFGAGAPDAAMEAGAVAVKQYAWYRTMNWRGGSSGGACYDIVDNGNDQWYLPLSKTPAQSHIDAVARTWALSIRRGGRFVSTGYWAGADVACGSNANGVRLMQKSAARCAREGKTAEEILRIYYGESISIVRPGANDLDGDGYGDVAALVTAPDGTVTARMYDGATLRAADDGATSSGEAWPVLLDVASPALRGTGDVDGDGRTDLVYTRRAPGGGTEVAVSRVMDGGMSSAGLPEDPAEITSALYAASARTVLQPPATWWTPGAVAADAAGFGPTALAVADFTGDGRADVALASDDPATGDLAIDILASTGSSFARPDRWWSGPHAGVLEAVRAGDFDGDGRVDVALVTADGSAGTSDGRRAFSVDVLMGLGTGALSDPHLWSDGTVVGDATTRELAGDWNRDGREDLILMTANGTSGVIATALLSDGSAFDTKVFRSTTTGFRLGVAKLTVADVNGDGRSDVVALYDAGAGQGTRVLPLVSTGTRLASLPGTLDPTLDWATVEPF